MSIWFDLSQFENWFIDHRGGFMGMFTHNRFFRLLASASPESDSSNNNDDTFPGLQNSSGWIVNTPPTKDVNIPHGSGPNIAISSESSVVTARPSSSSSSSSDSTIIVESSGPEAIEVLSGGNSASSSPDGQFTVASPTVEVTISTLSTNFQVSSASTVVVNTTGHSSLPQLSYGDIKEHLPPAGTPDFSNVPAAPSTAYTLLKVAQVMLGLPPTTTVLSKMTPPTNSMLIDASAVNKEKPITTKSYILGTNAFGNLGTPEQQISWLHQSAELALQRVQTPKHTSPGCSQPRKQIMPKDSDVSPYQFGDTPLDSKS